MEKIKLYINANIDDVKTYLEKLIDSIEKKYPKFDENYIKIKNETIKISYWNLIFDKLHFLNIIMKKEENNNTFITTILFLLFGNDNNHNIINIEKKRNIEQYENSFYSNEIINFRNCIIIMLIQIYIINENINIDDLIKTINRIIKCSFIKKSIHVIKSLLKKNINNEKDIFILSLFYFIYKKYQNLFIEFINSDNCDIKKEYKTILIKELQLFSYKENSVISYSNKIFEIKLSYSLLGLNPKNDKVIKFLETINDKKLKEELLEVFESYFDKTNLINNENYSDKKNNLLNSLKEIKNIKKDIKEIKNNLQELKAMQNNYMDDIFRVLNIMNKA